LKLQGLNSRGSVEQVMKDVKKQGGLNAEIQSRIGHQLRAMYDDVVRQGVPDRFAELIRKLDVPPSDPQMGPTGAPTAKTDGRD
jgi:Anti-sigma factor NepR